MYAPGTPDGESKMISILHSLKLVYNLKENECFDGWHLLPMLSSPEKKSDQLSPNQSSDLTSSSLGDKLMDALERTRRLLAKRKEKYQYNESVLFLGMDSPELPTEEIVYGLKISSANPTHHQCENNDNLNGTKGTMPRRKAHMCPADDGGYGLLSFPSHAPSSIFLGVRWSNSLTAVSQLKALTDAGIDVSIGRVMFDIDEPEDVHQLVKRLSRKTESDTVSQCDVLNSNASGISFSCSLSNDANKPCPFTLEALINLGMIDNILK